MHRVRRRCRWSPGARRPCSSSTWVWYLAEPWAKSLASSTEFHCRWTRRTVIARPATVVAVAVQRQHLGVERADGGDVARHLQAEHEGRQRGDALHAAHLDVVVAGDGGLDQVLARLRGRLDRRVERELGGAAGVGLGLAAQHGGGAERRRRRRTGCRRRTGSRRGPAASTTNGVCVTRQVIGRSDSMPPAKKRASRSTENGASSGVRCGPVSTHLEGRQAVGLLLHGERAAALAVLGLRTGWRSRRWRRSWRRSGRGSRRSRPAAPGCAIAGRRGRSPAPRRRPVAKRSAPRS